MPQVSTQRTVERYTFGGPARTFHQECCRSADRLAHHNEVEWMSWRVVRRFL
jgi:hypothetical protein